MPRPRTNEALAIRALNDQLRTTMNPNLGQIMMTRGVAALDPDTRQQIVKAVMTQDRFDEGNDPYSEHDFGSLPVGDHDVFWKIDYYDRDLLYGSAAPDDPAQTKRVLTIMLCEEY